MTTAFIQDWSSSNTADWNTAGFNGSYNLYAYTRQVGNPYQDAISIIGSFLVGRVCNTATLTVSPAPVTNTSPPLGTPINLTASAGCVNGGSPEYQYYYIPPGTESYVQISQTGVPANGWGGASATLDTSTLGAGRYMFYARTRAIGNSSSVEGFAYGPAFFYVGDVCPELQTTVSPPSSATTGTSVTLSASSLCLRTATPEYKFSYKLAAASTFTDIGGWQTANTATWNTAGLPSGSYLVQALVRARGNASTTEGYSLLPYTLSGFAIATNGGAPQPIYYGGAERSNDGAKDLAAYLKKMSGPEFAIQAIAGTGVPSQPGIYVASADVDAGRIPAA
ncbi:MAG TPA: hypothetical protein VER11_32105, partial [Polyangiaceae bacterium]|nr:hypothetical protein [Polyangiaceae bacterium]